MASTISKMVHMPCLFSSTVLWHKQSASTVSATRAWKPAASGYVSGRC
jgi:hypothetical protein